MSGGLRTLREVLADASAGGYAVGAFNVSTLDQAFAVLEAARAQRSPVIVQAIAGMHPYTGSESWWWSRLREAVDSYPELGAVLHLDHGMTQEDCRRAIDHGFTSVMLDASRASDGSPSTFEDNVRRTRAVVRDAHAVGVSVEGELGTVGGEEAGTDGAPEDVVYADPDQAEEFVLATGVDALAIAVGTSHGSVKFTDPSHVTRLRLDLIRTIAQTLPDTALVLHGSSSVPEAAVERINAAGGRVRPSYGCSTEQKQLGITSGIRKINQGTDSHLAWTAALRERLRDAPHEVEPSVAVGAGMEAMSSMVATRMQQFGSAGKLLTPA
ncbi:ketose-bisphosphate aldolase [Serinicoccus kebangsaanensis]|uniref:ketose-bisphosphate aldolase n=1 Tax=Serinicoccus kebangsaanensis TaxID=2602069 RepID=UPI001EE1869C|nr:ketose-bisphosphate aldolase [Serinicoccus kebangsaanensis]